MFFEKYNKKDKSPCTLKRYIRWAVAGSEGHVKTILEKKS